MMNGQVKQGSRTPLIEKRADLGGDGQDMPFEQAFSNLAHAYLKDKAPGLLDYEVGFQLVDRSEDNTEAVGIFGFKVGSQWLYAPVFFLSGQLKGHELLYIKNQDIFVPLKENWVNYLLNKRPTILGEGVDQNLQPLGVSSANLSRLSDSPTKFGSAKMPAWVQAVLPLYAHLRSNPTSPFTDEKYASVKSLPEFLEAEGVEVTKLLVKMAQSSPALAMKLESIHGMDAIRRTITKVAAMHRAASSNSVLSAIAKTASPRRPVIRGSVMAERPPGHPIKTGALQVITYDRTLMDDGLRDTLTDTEKKKVAKGGTVVRDTRGDDDVSHAYTIQLEESLTNPTESGIYEVLTNGHKYEKCLIICTPHGSNGREAFCIVVRLGDAKSWMNVHTSRVWVGKQYAHDEWDKFYDALPEAASFTPSRSARHMIISPKCDGTLVFKVQKTLGGADGKQAYDVKFETYGAFTDPVRRNGSRSHGGCYPCAGVPGNGDYDNWRDGERIHLGAAKGTRLRSAQGNVTVPEGFKKFTVKAHKLDEWEKDAPIEGHSPGGGSDPQPIQPGNLLDVKMDIMAKTSELKVWTVGDEAEINNGPRLSKMGAFRSLISDYGFRAAVATEMLKQADQAGGKELFRVKLANPFLQPGPGAPGFPEPPTGGDSMMGSSVPQQGPQQDLIEVPGMKADPGNADTQNPATPDPMAAQQAAQAGEAGQKEVFDTAMIGSLLKSQRDDTMVDRHLGDLMKGLDRTGRLLFLLYANEEQFEDRYGKTDMPELEDGLRNTFESMGDLVLFLKQKTVEAAPDEMSEVDLSNSAAM
jgi:hypothetical protein